MTATVKIQPVGFCVSYPKTPWRVIFVEDSAGKFYFRLCGTDFRFEPRDRYRYPSYDAARRGAFCFLELLKRLERSRMRLSVLAEVGIIKFPQENYLSHELWLLVDRTRYTWEALTPNGYIRSQHWYKHPNTALTKGRCYIERELAIAQIRDIVWWV
jgi:hypothetical protein